MKKRIYYLMFSMLLVSLVIIAWTPKPLLAQPPGEIRIGVNVTMSGAGAAWGITYSRTAEAYADKINKEGGLLVGGKRYLIKLFEYDSKSDPATSVENAKKLVFTDKVRFILHHGGVAVTPTLPILSENKIVSMDISVGPQILKWPYNFNILSAGPLRSEQSMVAFIKQFKIKTISEVNPDNESGYTTEVDDRRAAKQKGIEMLNHQFYPSETTDFYPILTKSLAVKPDMLVIGLGSPGDTPLIVKQARELGWQGPIGMTQGSPPSEETFVRMTGQSGEGFVWSNPWHTDPNFWTKQEQAWVDEWKVRYAQQAFIADSFGGCKQNALLLEAVKKAGSLDPDKITKVLETSDFVVLGWKIHFGATPDTYMGRPRSLVSPVYLQTIKDGKTTIIDVLMAEGVEKVQ